MANELLIVHVCARTRVCMCVCIDMCVYIYGYGCIIERQKYFISLLSLAHRSVVTLLTQTLMSSRLLVTAPRKYSAKPKPCAC